jgi:drug/metabolite transporter (DMT)-like permease
MTISITLAILFAIISPLAFGLSNTFDKFIISKKVKHSLGFAMWAGISLLIFGTIIGLFLNWDSVTFKDILPIIFSGIIWGAMYLTYYKILEKADASNYVGLVYAYPVLMAFLSFIFLKEILSLWAYVGVIISILGAILLSIRIKKLHGKNIILLLILTIIGAAVYEFLIKISITNLAEWNGISLEMIFTGLTICSLLISKKVRKITISEIKNLKLALSSEFLTTIGISTTFFAMSSLSPTVVATIATIQPLSILFFERLTRIFGKIHSDKLTLIRIISILLTIGGVVIITIAGT